MKPHVPTFGTDAYYASAVEPAFNQAIEKEYASLPSHVKSLVPRPAFLALANSKKSEILRTAKVTTELALPHILDRLNAFWNRIGILCLSECYDNLLMWAHYADSHKGFVIEFDEQNTFFDQRVSQNDELRYLRKVQYSETRPSRPFADIDSLDAFLTKSSHWAYEQEWRMLLPLEQATRITQVKPIPVHLFTLPPSAFRSIYFGCRADASLVSDVMEILKYSPALSHVKMYRGSIDNQHFRLNFELVA